MTGKLGDQGLDSLEQRFQALRDQVGAMPEACRTELETALQELSQAIAALRAAQQSSGTDLPGGQEVQAGQGGESHSPVDPAAYLGPCEAMLRHVFNAIPDLFNVIDPDLNILMSNWHGQDSVTATERCSRPKCYRLYWHRDRPCEDCQVLEVFATGRPVKVEKFNPIDGRALEIHAFPIKNESGRVVLVVEHVREITERHLAEEALRESEERFRSLFEYAPDAYLLMDLQGNFLDVNRVYEELTGYTREELIGKNLPLLDDRQKSLVSATLEQAVNDNL